MESVNMHAIIGTVLKNWRQQERCQKYSTEQLMHNKRAEAVVSRYGQAHDQLRLGSLQQERLILKAKLVAAEGKAAELLFSCNLLRTHLELEKESTECAAEREAARDQAQQRALSSEKEAADQKVIEFRKKAESIAKKLESTMQHNFELCKKVDQLTSGQVKHKSGEKTTTADTGLANNVPVRVEAVEEEYARRIVQKDEMLAKAVEVAEMLRERLELMEAEGPVSQVVQDVMLQETESQNEDLKLQVDTFRQSEEKLLSKARHRDSVLEEKTRELQLVSQERDRLQTSLKRSKLESKTSGHQAAQTPSESRVRELEMEAGRDQKLRLQLEDQLLDAKIALQRSIREKAEADSMHELQEQRLRGAEETIKQLQNEKARLRNLCEDLDKTVRQLSAAKQSAENAHAHARSTGPGLPSEPRQEKAGRKLVTPIDTRPKTVASSGPQGQENERQQATEKTKVPIPVLQIETEEAEPQDKDTPPEEFSQFLNMSLVTPDSTDHDTQPGAEDSEEDGNKNQKPGGGAKMGKVNVIPSSGSQMDTDSDSQSPEDGAGGADKTHQESASIAKRGVGNRVEAVVVESESGAKGSTGRGSELPWEKEAPNQADDDSIPVYTRRTVSRKQKAEQRVEEIEGVAEESQDPVSRVGEYEFDIQAEGLPEQETHGKKREGNRGGRKRKGDAKADGKENEEWVPLPKPKRKTKAKQMVEVEAELERAEADIAEVQVGKPEEIASKRQVFSRVPLVSQNQNVQQAVPPNNPRPPPAAAISAGSVTLPRGGAPPRPNAAAHLPPLPSQSTDGNPKKRRLTRITPLPPSPLGQSAAPQLGSGWGGGERGGSFGGRPASHSSVSMFTNAFKKDRRESLAHSNSGVKKFVFSPAL